jgi:preprotein translocase subunit YajC
LSILALALALAFPAGGFGGMGGLPLLVIMFTTTGGIRGQIVSVKDDVLVIKTAPDNIKLEVVRSAVAAVTTDEVTKA